MKYPTKRLPHSIPPTVAEACEPYRPPTPSPQLFFLSRFSLIAAVEEDEVMKQLDQPQLLTDLEQVFVELEAAVVRFVFLPFQKMECRWHRTAALPNRYRQK